MEEQISQHAVAGTEPADTAAAVLDNDKKKSRKKKRILVWLIVLLLLLLVAAAGVYLFCINTFYLDLELLGEEEILVQYGQSYEEPGANVYLKGTRVLQDGILPDDLTLNIESNVSTEELGLYKVTYSAEYYGLTARTERSVRVADWEPPVITLTESGKTLIPGTEYEEEGYTAIDNYDGDITDQVRCSVVDDVVTYVVMDSSGNPSFAERKIVYYDPEFPSLELEGGELVQIPSGTIYQDPGYRAYDEMDGDLTDQVEIEGEVLWYIPGTYELTYSISDSYDNTVTAKRTIEVIRHELPETKDPKGKVIYLTFDDGPGPDTDRLLRVLDKYGVKATFFVVDTGYYALMDRIVEKGHSIGVHSATHKYEEIYASPEAFFTDFYRVQNLIKEYTGVTTKLMRFPGGSSNLISIFNKGIMTTLTQAANDAGLRYVDWNVDSNDAGGATKADTVFGNVITGVQKQDISVVLQHDIYGFSVEAVERIIVWGLENGYTFLPMDMTSPICQHDVVN